MLEKDLRCVTFQFVCVVSERERWVCLNNGRQFHIHVVRSVNTQV